MNYQLITVIFLILSNLFGKDWNYSADILEKKIENGKEIRLFKSKNLNGNLVHIYNDTISIFTREAKQYPINKELHLIGPVTMINKGDSLTCTHMKFWYEVDSLQASGNVDFKFKNYVLKTDSLMYVETSGFRGCSFEASNNSKFNDSKYEISADNIHYNDYTQIMDLFNSAEVKSKNQGARGDNMNLKFQDSTIHNIIINNNGYLFNEHKAIINNSKYQLFKDEMKGNLIKVEFENNALKNVFIEGMAESIYYIVNDSIRLMGFNEVTGNTMQFNYDNEELSQIYISGDARGIFHPEKGQTKIDSMLKYRANKIDYYLNDELSILTDNVEINYQKTKLISNNVKVNWENNILYAISNEDEESEISSANQNPITGKNLEFDLINKKGTINLGKTKVGNGINSSYYKSNIIYREEPNIYHMHQSIYTTCDHENPHYYFKTPKMKMLQGDQIIAKPLWLFIYDFPVLGIPFAVLPNKGGNRQSGWIMPSFGVSNSMGTFFQKLGYYWAPNDYIDTKLLLDFYDEDRIELRSDLRYKKRYYYTGSLSSTLKRELNRNLTDDISDLFTNKTLQNFDIRWNHKHQIDNTQNLNINWIYVTSNNFYNDIGYDLNTTTQQKLESAAGYSKIWPAYSNRLTISISESYDLQKDRFVPEISDETDLNYSTIEYYKSRVLPNVRFSHSNSKIFGKGDKWYNSIYYGFSSRLNGVQKIGHLFQNPNIDNLTWDANDTTQYTSSIVHNVNFAAPNKFFGWLNLNPSLTLNEGWIFKYNNGGEEKNGFKRRLTGSVSLSSNTTLYGLFPVNLLNIESIKHTISPSISINYKPDFSKPLLGINLNYFDENGNDYFENSAIGSTSSNETKKINFSMRNNFDIKLNDSSRTKFEFLFWKISSGYNFTADSLNMDIIKSQAKLYIPNGLDIDFSMHHDPYQLDENLNRLNEYAKLPILTYLQAETDISLIGNQLVSNSNITELDTLGVDEKTNLYNSNKFFEPEINNNTIWELNLRVGAKLQKKLINETMDWDKTLWMQPLLKLKLSEKWKFTYAAQFDMINNQIISQNMYLYRTLHCWEFGFKWYPSGSRKGFLLNIRVKSPDLRDIKIKDTGGSLFGF